MAAQHHDDGHDPNLAHHFESAEQQFQASKLGMWIFLATEILFFGGLFTAYTVYRSNHPEIFIFGHQFLDKNLGALNTVILIFSSFTIAWAVRAAQLKQIKLLKWLLVVTMLCAFGFLGVKYVEYSAKWKHGLLWAAKYDPHIDHEEAFETEEVTIDVHENGADVEIEEGEEVQPVGDAEMVEPTTGEIQIEDDEAPPATDPERSTIPPAAVGPAGLAAPAAPQREHALTPEPANARTFFSIYFLMTGLHGIHVIGGIGAMVWLLMCASRGDFNLGHFTRVDMVALYWHVVDIIWIYLFLLLYLIH
jgi:cytochrome c oxidase subunit 3